MKNSQIAPTDGPGEAPTPVRTIPPHRILVVEDDGDIRSLNAQVLKLFGYRVDTAEDGFAAWDTIQQNKYDLLITDNEMPNMTGIELLKKLQTDRVAMAVIMATGKLPEEEFSQHPCIRPVAMLLKPYTADELLWTVKKVLYAVDLVRQQVALPQGQPTADGLQP